MPETDIFSNLSPKIRRMTIYKLSNENWGVAMEWALGISHLGNIHQIASPWEGVKIVNAPEIKTILEGLFGTICFKRLYFGQEFCDRAIPPPGELLEAVQHAGDHEMNFTLVTPYATERGLRKLQDLFEEFVKLQPAGEVVVNDWGVLYLLAAKFPTLIPVAGRLMNKIYRDPRMDRYLEKGSGKQTHLFCRSGLAGPYMQKLLKELKVNRIELDNTFQGLDSDLPRWGYRVSMYVPYGCITSGRSCLFGSWGLERKEKFNATRKTCSHQCRSHWLAMQDRSGQVDAKSLDWRILQKGNTIFYQQLKDFLTRGLTQAKELGVDRIVYQPEPI